MNPVVKIHIIWDREHCKDFIKLYFGGGQQIKSCQKIVQS